MPSPKNFVHHAYVMNTLTNLHAGSGNAEYGIIDKLVQRDLSNHYPTVHSSSIKGAYREYFEEEVGLDSDKVRDIFGSPVHNKPDAEAFPGKYRFFSADLLSLPARSSALPFFRLVSPGSLRTVQNRLQVFGIKKYDAALDWLIQIAELQSDGRRVIDAHAMIFEQLNHAVIEDLNTHCHRIGDADKLHLKTCQELLGNSLALVNDEQFRHRVDSLPVIARNQLENGQSENLWYEQVVARETRFVTFVSVPADLHFADFDLDGKTVQIGANASIGYGFTYFQKLV